MGKIMGKLKNHYNAFLALQTKFFHKQWVTSSFLPSINEFHHNLHTLEIPGKNLEQSTMRKKLQQEVSPIKLFQI